MRTMIRSWFCWWLLRCHPNTYGFSVHNTRLRNRHHLHPPSQRQRILSSSSATTSITTTTILRYNTTVSFPFRELNAVPFGQSLSSPPFRIADQYDFCIQIYPRGGGHRGSSSVASSSTTTNWIDSIPLVFPTPREKYEKVGVYLRYIPNPKKEDDPSSLQNDKTIDVSFGIRLVGNQQSQLPKFDLEWRAGMRFASSTCLRKGYAQDFGAHLLQSRLLPEFLGIQPNVQNDDDDDDEAYQHNHKLNIQVNMILHRPNTAPTMPYQQHQDKDDAVKSAAAAAAPSDAMLLYNINFGKLFRGGLDRIFQDMRQFSSSSSNQHDSTTNDDQDKGVRVGKIVVPVLQKLAQRPKLMAMGCYPGVEYRILRILAHSNNKNTSIIGNHNNSCVEEDIFYHRPGASYVIKPIYPLVPALERAWPVTVPEQDIPLLVSPTSYNILSAVGSLATAVTGLLAAFCVSQAISVFYIPSKSMEPTLNVGNVLLVEKITSRVYTSTLSSFLQSDSYYRVGDVILFEPPYQLREFVLSNGGRLTNRDLFVKRVAGIPGDRLEIDEAGSVVGITRIDGVSGEVKFLPNQNRNLCGEEPLGLIRQYVSKKVIIVPPKSVAVLGDCSSVSIDSRVWGVLPMENIVGRPLFRIWPASEFGLVPSIAASTKSPIHPEQQLSSPLVTQWQEDN